MIVRHLLRACGRVLVFPVLLASCTEATHTERVSAERAPLTFPGLFLQGDNFSGAERGFGAAIEESWGPAIPGVEGQTYSWPLPAKNTLPAGMNIIRLPFQWERLQPTLSAEFDPGYLEKLRATASAWQKLGANVLLDVHNYAYYKVSGRGTDQPGQHIGSSSVPSAAFADLWRRLALEFGSASTSSPFIFGLMNEPHDISAAVWVEAAQLALDAIRSTGAKNPVFVPGADWTTAADFAWSENKTRLQSVTDPLGNFAIEVHQYFDGTCTPGAYVEKLKPFEDWAVENQRVAFLGELDLTDSTAACEEAFANLISHLHERSAGQPNGVWVGYTYWEGTRVLDAISLLEPQLPSTCGNRTKDGSESDMDCGGSCLRCPDTKTCAHDYDCQSGFCSNGVCDSGATGAGGASSSGGTGPASGGTVGNTGGAGNGISLGGSNASSGGASAGGSMMQGGSFGAGMTGAGGRGSGDTSGGSSVGGSLASGGAASHSASLGGAPAFGGSTSGANGDAGGSRVPTTTKDDAAGCSCRLNQGSSAGGSYVAIVGIALVGILRRRRLSTLVSAAQQEA